MIQKESVDMIYSQAVLEHVDELPGVYGAMRRWLQANGVMSHQIDQVSWQGERVERSLDLLGPGLEGGGGAAALFAQ